MISSLLFVDVDAVWQTLQREDEEAAHRFIAKPAVWLQRLVFPEDETALDEEAVRIFAVQRAYADLSAMSADTKAAWIACGFQMVDASASAAPMMIAFDADDVAHSGDGIYDEVVLLTGASDVSPLLMRLRAQMVMSAVMTGDDAHAAVLSLADDLITLDDLTGHTTVDSDALEAIEDDATALDDPLSDEPELEAEPDEVVDAFAEADDTSSSETPPLGLGLGLGLATAAGLAATSASASEDVTADSEDIASEPDVALEPAVLESAEVPDVAGTGDEASTGDAIAEPEEPTADVEAVAEADDEVSDVGAAPQVEVDDPLDVLLAESLATELGDEASSSEEGAIETPSDAVLTSDDPDPQHVSTEDVPTDSTSAPALASLLPIDDEEDTSPLSFDEHEASLARALDDEDDEDSEPEADTVVAPIVETLPETDASTFKPEASAENTVDKLLDSLLAGDEAPEPTNEPIVAPASVEGDGKDDTNKLFESSFSELIAGLSGKRQDG